MRRPPSSFSNHNVFLESGAEAQAAEHLRMAYQLFGLLGHERARARVLSYGAS